MDLEEEGSNSLSEAEKIEKEAPLDGIKADGNGGIGSVVGQSEIKDVRIDTIEDNGIGDEKSVHSSTEAIGYPPMVEKEPALAESPPKSCGSPLNSAPEVGSSSPATRKGFGLKKWRRIRRDLSKEGAGNADSAQILKRRLSINEPPKAAQEESKVKSDGEGEIAGPAVSVGSLPSAEVKALDQELELLIAGTGFSIGVDSDNSEDRSSKSSTAASAPKPRHETDFGRERGRTKNLGGRGSGHAVQQRGQRGRGGGVDASKKFRGDRVRLEKENSQSSVESDLRSSNMGFMRWSSGVSNGKQSEKSSNYDGEHSDEAQTCEEVRSGYYKENGGDEHSLKEDLDEDITERGNIKNSENGQTNSDLDPFSESIVMLHAAQEALEKEIQIIGEIGKEAALDDSDDHFEGTEVSSSPSCEAHLLELGQKIECLEYKLEEASATVKARESRVLELEAVLNRIQSREEGSQNTSPFLHEQHEEIELEVEDLLKKKIEAEIEYLIITRITHNWKVVAEDQIALFEEQRSLAGDQANVMLKLMDAENKAVKLKEQAEELEAHCNELLETEKVLKLQNKVCKFSLCCFVQLVMLCVAFGLLLMQLLPPSNGVVPT